jgi:hypothetical protein
VIHKEFHINKYLSLKLENGATTVYVNGVLFLHCKYLLLDIPIEEMTFIDDLKSIDEASVELNHSLESFNLKKKISPEVEFWGHCSNLQVWFENDYNTNLLHSSLSFPLLEKLSKVGDAKARKVFKEEIIKRLEDDYLPVILYLIETEFLDYFSLEELGLIISSLKKKPLKVDYNLILDLFFKGNLSSSINGKVFLISDSRIRLIRMVVKYGSKYIDKGHRFRFQLYDYLEDLVEKTPEILEDVLIDDLYSFENGEIVDLINLEIFDFLDINAEKFTDFIKNIEKIDNWELLEILRKEVLH